MFNIYAVIFAMIIGSLFVMEGSILTVIILLIVFNFFGYMYNTIKNMDLIIGVTSKD